jgi:amidase
MTHWRRIWTIATFEFLQAVKRPGYLIATFGMPLFLAAYAGIIAVPAYFAMRSGKEPAVHGVVDAAGLLQLQGDERSQPRPIPEEVKKMVDAAGQSAALDQVDLDEEFVFRPFASEADARAALTSRAIKGYFVLPADYLERGGVDVYTLESIDLTRAESRSAFARLLRERLVATRLAPPVSERVVDPLKDTRRFSVSTTGQLTDGGNTASIVRIAVPILFTVLFLMSVLMTSGFLMQGTATEKENKVVEVLLASANPDEILSGKLLGLGGAGLLQIVVWLALLAAGGLGIVPMIMASQIEMPWASIALAVPLFLMAFLFYGSLMLGTGSLGSNMREAQQLAMVWSLTAALPLMMMAALLREPHGIVARVMTLVPFSAAPLIIFRTSTDMASLAWWEIFTALALLVLSTWVALRVGARLFRVGLLSASRPKLREILRQARLSALVLACVGATVSGAAAQQKPAGFEVQEATIARIHAALQSKAVTCRGLVERYLARIEAYDKKGPGLNAIVVVNPRALDEADEKDRALGRGAMAGALFCIPAIVKDNFETIGLQSAAGSLAFQGFVSARDAFQVKRIKDAGAIVLAKSNMAEFAFSPYETVSSILPGYTKNPYALDRVTAGSSGGTAAAVAASFAAIGLGSDTGNSIRGPSSHQALAGIRSTMGLTSRSGVVPLSLLADIAGPMTRTLEDAVTVLQVIAGPDPDDPVTVAETPLAQAFSPAGRPAAIPSYAAALRKDGLKGRRIGILRQAYERDTTDPEIVKVFMAAVDDMKRAGAVIVDPVRVDLDQIRRPQGSGSCGGFKYDINRWLASHGERAPMKDLAAIIQSRRFHPSVQRRLEQSQDGTENGIDSPACKAEAEYRARVRAAVLETMAAEKLDGFAYPTWSNPPRLIGDLNTAHGDNSQFFSPTTGFPSINVPMGYTRDGALPAGLTFFGRPWDESGLIALAYGYEQATRHRRAPKF